jgi:glycosyltransferase involved in cell wall biosynthesis
MKICYFGNYNPELSRNKIYQKGLRENGAEIIECRDGSRGLSKFARLWKKHNEIKGKYDLMIVGYTSYSIVPFAKLLSSTPVIFDALGTFWEAQTLSHEGYSPTKAKIIDWLAVKCADMVLVETEEQKKFFIKRFGGKPDKYQVIYTGVDDSVFYRDPSIPLLPQFTVLFRGRLTPEAGVKHVLGAAKILENEDIFFRIIGFGEKWNELTKQMSDMNIRNAKINKEELSFGELRKQMSECHVSLGQFEDHERLKRTIPHKAFESLAMRIPYITGRAEGVSELLTGGINCLMVNVADAKDLSIKILKIKNDQKLAQKITENGRILYEKKLTPRILAKRIIDVASKKWPDLAAKE